MSANAAESQSYIESDTTIVSYIVSDMMGALQYNLILQTHMRALTVMVSSQVLSAGHSSSCKLTRLPRPPTIWVTLTAVLVEEEDGEDGDAVATSHAEDRSPPSHSIKICHPSPQCCTGARVQH